jgi:hypothetical protein
VLTRIAEEAAARQEPSVAGFALREAVRILAFHGQDELARKTAQYWRELDPDNPEIDRWLGAKE